MATIYSFVLSRLESSHEFTRYSTERGLLDGSFRRAPGDGEETQRLGHPATNAGVVLTRALQLRSRTRSSFLLKIQERPRKAINIIKPRLEDALLMTVSETWPKA